jgi:hypothetical protein
VAEINLGPDFVAPGSGGAPAFKGGQKLMAYLSKLERNLTSAGDNPEVRVGFLENAKYPDGKSVAAIAAQNEFGGVIQREAGEVTVYRKVAASGTHFLRNGRFVKRKDANFSSTHTHGAYEIRIPPRPFFRNMIKKHGPEWGGDIAKLLVPNEFNAAKVLGLMGQRIVGQLRQSIVDTNEPPNAPSTIARKGFNKPLVDTGHMLNSADFEVST